MPKSRTAGASTETKPCRIETMATQLNFLPQTLVGHEVYHVLCGGCVLSCDLEGTFPFKTPVVCTWEMANED